MLSSILVLWLLRLNSKRRGSTLEAGMLAGLRNVS